MYIEVSAKVKVPNCREVAKGTLTTDYVWQIPLGTMKSHSPTSCIRSSTATLLSLRRKQIKSSWASVSSSNPSPFATALHAISTRLWHHSRHLHWTSNSLALYLDYSWSPNVRTLLPKEIEVLPHCTVCTKLQVFRNLT